MIVKIKSDGMNEQKFLRPTPRTFTLDSSDQPSRVETYLCARVERTTVFVVVAAAAAAGWPYRLWANSFHSDELSCF